MNNDAMLKKLNNEIEGTRIKLHKLISEKKFDLLDSEVIKLSQLLDKLLSQYDDLN